MRQHAVGMQSTLPLLLPRHVAYIAGVNDGMDGLGIVVATLRCIVSGSTWAMGLVSVILELLVVLRWFSPYDKKNVVLQRATK